MYEKFTIEELVIRVMPGGFLIGITFFIFGYDTQLNMVKNLDFLYTFLFFCAAFILGELLQTLAHELERMIDIFFKLRRPSQIFLYKNNPVLKSEHHRNEIVKHLELSEDKTKIIEQEYSSIPIFFGRKNKNDDLIQSIFWKLYHQISNNEEIKISNRSYLFVRVITIEFLLISVLLFVNDNTHLGIASILIFLLFLWRSRGVARGLVFKTVLLNLKEK